MTFDLEEYEICRRRGHSPGPSAFTNMAGTTFTCRYCGIGYKVEVTTEIIEFHHDQHNKVHEVRVKQSSRR